MLYCEKFHLDSNIFIKATRMQRETNRAALLPKPLLLQAVSKVDLLQTPVSLTPTS